MDILKVTKAIGNETRLSILEWLKDPESNFGKQEIGDFKKDGVCVTLIQEKTELGQSTISHYLSLLLGANLLKSKRIGQWTFYSRNEETIKEYLNFLKRKIQ
ncbi:helix-turn-helix transcriptional regulator [Leptospira sp. 201903071]|uniref:ArsR/SmtB family transcription factor n=1 Tax=Leptospira ainazelensis TaxID=2810034 RepID=UPI001962AEDE|nr:helix-turn-helix transcriptional regulator [Leptospira ainazelensis]MBM9502533.1 helix-turn-helix transcriptional regulator [Leptospira ainazelensis]